MTSINFAFSCVLLLSCCGSLWAFVTTNPDQTVTTGGICTSNALFMSTSSFPTWMLANNEYLLPDNHTYNFFLTARNQAGFQDIPFSPSVNLAGTWFDPNKPTMIIVHAFTDFAFDVHYLFILTEYLKLVDGNVILLDWFLGTTALNNYPQSVANAEGAACQVAILIQNLVQQRGYNIKNFHLVGFSLGGQTVGLIGKQVQNLLGNTVGRISALDPAGEWYLDQTDPSLYVHKGDADFVDVIHAAGQFTDATQVSFGEINDVGDVDFYPDGGREQTVCPASIGIVNDVTDVCAHVTAPYFFGDSINGPCNFTSCSCNSVPNPSTTSADWNQCLNNCNPLTSSVMGYHSIEKPGTGPQYLTISSTNIRCTTVFSLLKINQLVTYANSAIAGLLYLLNLYGYVMPTQQFIQTGIGGIANKFAGQLPPSVLATLSLPGVPLLG